MIETTLEYAAFGSSLVSVWLYRRHDRWGPLAGIWTAITYIGFGIVTGIYAAVLANIIFLVLHGHNLRAVMLTKE